MAGRRATAGEGKAGRNFAPRARADLRGVAAAMLGIAAALLAQTASAQVSNEGGLRSRVAQASSGSSPRIAVLATVLAEPSSQMPLQIRIGPVEAVPKNSFLRLRGLPPTAALSPGHAIAPGAWAVPLNGLPSLTLSLPAGVSGRSEVIITLVGEDGTLFAETRVVLVIQPAPPPAAAEEKRPLPALPPPRAPPPVLSAAERAGAEKLLERGDRELEQGNIAIARQFYLRAAQIGLARGALMLAATYDPRELARLRAVGVVPNVAEARKWYERALELGASEATERLATLGGGG